MGRDTPVAVNTLDGEKDRRDSIGTYPKAMGSVLRIERIIFL